MPTCKNCNTETIGKFCHNCGQKTSAKRIEMKWLLHELPHAIWHIEKGFFYNVIQLFKRPGYAIADYLAGKRKNFYHPVSYLLIILAAMYLVMHYLEAQWYDPVQDAWMSTEKAKFWIDYDASQQLATIHYPQFLLSYLPGTALIFWLWLRLMKRKYNFAESIIISFFSTSQMFVPQLTVFFLASIIDIAAVTRILDPIFDGVLIFLIFFFQIYQLANPVLRKSWRLILSAIGAALIWIWIFVALAIESWLINLL